MPLSAHTKYGRDSRVGTSLEKKRESSTNVLNNTVFFKSVKLSENSFAVKKIQIHYKTATYKIVI